MLKNIHFKNRMLPKSSKNTDDTAPLPSCLYYLKEQVWYCPRTSNAYSWSDSAVTTNPTQILISTPIYFSKLLKKRKNALLCLLTNITRSLQTAGYFKAPNFSLNCFDKSLEGIYFPDHHMTHLSGNLSFSSSKALLFPPWKWKH